MQNRSDLEKSFDDFLTRISKYEFNSEIREHIILKEIHTAYSDLKAYIDELLEGNELEELEKKIATLEKNSEELLSDAIALTEKSDRIKADIDSLETSRDDTETKIAELETEDSDIDELINTIVSDSVTEFNLLDENDSNIRSTLDAEKLHLNSEIEIRSNQVDEIDIDDINKELKSLQDFDKEIKNKISSNYQEVTRNISELEDEVNIIDITNDMTELKNTDENLNGKIDTLTENSNSSIATLKTQDESFRENINLYEQRVKVIEKDSERGSTTATEGKIPIALESGKLADGWLETEEPPEENS